MDVVLNWLCISDGFQGSRWLHQYFCENSYLHFIKILMTVPHFILCLLTNIRNRKNPFRQYKMFQNHNTLEHILLVLTGTLMISNNLVPVEKLSPQSYKNCLHISESHLAGTSILTLTVAAVHVWEENKHRENIRFEFDTLGSGTCIGAGACSCYRKVVDTTKVIHAWMKWQIQRCSKNMQWNQTAEVKTTPQGIPQKIYNS